MRQKVRWVTVLLLAGAGGCVVGPKYETPTALKSEPLPTAFAGSRSMTSAVDWKAATPSADLPRGAWWTIFGDANLNRLEQLADVENQTLAAAAARFEEARALVQVSRSDLFPQLGAGVNATAQRTSANAPQLGRSAGEAYTYGTFTLPLDLQWELDLWGRIRHQNDAARAGLAATADDLESLRLGVQAELAANYFSLRSLEAESTLVTNTIEAYQRSLQLTRNRREGGIVSDLDVAQAGAQLRATEAELPALELQRARLLHALATLCGKSPTGFELKTDHASQKTAPDVPSLVPGELLERRPDIASAERRMAAANAAIGIAQSAFYPRVRFNGLAGLQSIDAGSWFDWPSRFWAVGPVVELPLFTAGKLRGQRATAMAGYDETVANYRGTVLRAFQEVEDGLSAVRLLERQLQAETAALAEARRTVAIADDRYQNGLVTYLEVATAQGAALAREQAVVRLRGGRLVATVGLIKALGGGWSRAYQQEARGGSSAP